MNKALLLLLGVVVIAGIAAYAMIPQTGGAPADASATSTATATIGSYADSSFGVSFAYDPAQVGVSAQGTSSVAVYALGTDPQQGQRITRFSKPSSETLEQSIRSQILAGYSTSTCTIEQSPQPSGYVRAEIGYPVPDQNPLGHEELCNASYDKTNGIRYFLYDPSHPDRFYFVSIGQYPLLARENTPWQDTIIIK